MTASTEPASFYAKYRKQILLAVLGAIGVVAGGDWLMRNLLEGPIDEARQRAARYEREIEKREGGLSSIRKAGQFLEGWERQSLPADPETARSLYQAWLVELVDDCQFEGPSVNSNEPSRNKAGYFTIAFTVRGRGTLEQLTRFLYAFYHTDLLHQILSVGMTPVSGGEKLDVSLAIEAMGLPGAGPSVSSKLPADARQRLVFDDFRQRVARASDKLASETLADYAAVYRRNFFSVGGSSDPIDSTYLTSVISSNGRPQAWFTLRTTDEVRKLGPGETLEIGEFRGKIAEISGGDVILESGGQRWLLTLGESLTNSTALPPEF